MRIFKLLIIALVPFHSHGQAVAPDSASIEKLYANSRKYWYNTPDSAVHYLDMVLRQSRAIGYRRGEANALKGFGFFAVSNHERLRYHIQALEIREAIGDSVGIGVSLGDIAGVYDRLKDYEKMDEYYRRSLAVRRKINDHGGIALVLINLSKYRQEQERYDEALTMLEEALRHRELARDLNGIAYAHVNLGEVYRNLKKFDVAIEYAKRAKDEFAQVNNAGGYHWAAVLSGELLFDLKQPDNALRALKEVEQPIFDDVRHEGIKVRMLRVQADCYAVKKDFEKAFNLKNAWITERLEDEAKANNEAARALAADYEYQMKERELRKAEEQQIATKRRRNNLQLLSIAMGVMTLFGIIISMRKKISVRFVNGLTFVGFLFLFEFLILLIEPRLQRLTNEEPLLMLMANALVALAIFPVHQFIEKYFRKRIIRLQASKAVESTVPVAN